MISFPQAGLLITVVSAKSNFFHFAPQYKLEAWFGESIAYNQQVGGQSTCTESMSPGRGGYRSNAFSKTGG
ncbi:hypothetical protein KOSB73_100030 [Klebsiella grimontii]|uniref:Uncharacterized protein n=1 Tax=Klebsiella grimontii TaxID=2058152 RepID=A0A285AV39_9ENTR|nr:hypothetical protein KOSB73_100030 [Klebsiella grimontii]